MATPIQARRPPRELIIEVMSGGFLSEVFARNEPDASLIEEHPASRLSLAPLTWSSRETVEKWLVPPGSQELLEQRSGNGARLSEEAVLAPMRKAGERILHRNRAFAMLREPVHEHAMAMFVAGSVLFILSSVFGLAGRAEHEPVLPPRPGSNGRPLLPPLLVSPFRTTTNRRA